jgi:pilus assembly protein CpaE
MFDTVNEPDAGMARDSRTAASDGAETISWRSPPPDVPADLFAFHASVSDSTIAPTSAGPAFDDPPDAPPMTGGATGAGNARVITVLSPKGGVGRTMVATNLALALANLAPGRVVIVDLDLQFGDVSTALKLTPTYTFAHARLRQPPDGASVMTCLTPHPANLFALCAPATPVDAEDVKPREASAVLALLAREFPYVVIDTPSGLDEHTLHAIDMSTDLVVVSATDVSAIRNTRKELDVLRRIAPRNQRLHLVLNRADARTGLHHDAIESVLGARLDVEIPSSGTVPLALNQGSPLVEADARSAVSRAVLKLARELAPEDALGTSRKRWRKRRGAT